MSLVKLILSLAVGSMTAKAEDVAAPPRQLQAVVAANLPCTGYNYYRAAPSNCQPCPANTYVTTAGTSCLSCPDYQYMSPMGACTNCPTGQLTVDGRTCGWQPQPVAVSQPCPSYQIRNVGGGCSSCPTGQVTLNQMSCQAPPPQKVICGPRQRRISDYLCETCGPYTYLSVNGRDCLQCAAGMYATIDGQCKNCEDGFITKDGRTCVKNILECKPREKRVSDTVCKPCNPYERVSPKGDECLKCPADQIASPHGVCSPCPAGQETRDGRTCQMMKVTCGPRQKRLSATQCIDCPAYTKVSQDGYRCENCPSNQIALVDGSCKDCPAGQATKDGRTCYTVKVQCKANEKRLSLTQCEKCPDYTRVSSDGASCLRCPQGQIASKAGVCRMCPAGYGTVDGINCVQLRVACGYRQRRISNTQCQTCPPYTTVSQDGTQCTGCGSNTQMISAVGVCSPCCQGCITRDQGRTCVQQRIECGARQKRLSLTQCETCPDYTFLSADGKSCQNCPSNQIATKEGLCSLCMPGWATTDQRTCKQLKVQCGPRQKRLSDFACETCPAYTRLSPDKANCLGCPADQIVSPLGVCSSCPAGQKVNAARNGCDIIKVKCGIRQKRISWTECKECDLYTRVSDDGRYCVGCGAGMIADKMGVCSHCPPGQKTYDGRTCVVQTVPCGPRQIRVSQTECKTCDPFTKPNDLGSACIGCPAGQLVDVNGYCSMCPPHHQTKDQRTCVPLRKECGPRQRRISDTQCENCPAYTRLSDDGTKCLDTCQPNYIISYGGVCSPCQQGYITTDTRVCQKRPSTTIINQQQVACGVRQYRISPTQCGTCPAYTYVSNDGLSCGRCQQGMIASFNGGCSSCPYGQQTINGRNCVQQQQVQVQVHVACGPRQRRVSATQCANCPDFTRVSNDLRSCVACSAGWITQKDGSCKSCPAGQVIAQDGRSCMVVCGPRERRISPTVCQACEPYTKLSSNGQVCESCPVGWVASPMGMCSRCPSGFVTTDQRTCKRNVICPPYTRLSADGMQCVTCPLDNVALADGTCKQCEPGTQTIDQRSCTPIPCKTSEIKVGGKCVCPDFTMRQRNGECRQSFCHYRQILMKDGSCKDCALYTMPDTAKRSCIEPKCPATQICRPDATCSPCGWNMRPDTLQRNCVPVTYTTAAPVQQVVQQVVQQPVASTCAWGNCGFRDEVFLSDTGAFQFYQPNQQQWQMYPGQLTGNGRRLEAKDEASKLVGIN